MGSLEHIGRLVANRLGNGHGNTSRGRNWRRKYGARDISESQDELDSGSPCMMIRRISGEGVSNLDCSPSFVQAVMSTTERKTGTFNHGTCTSGAKSVQNQSFNCENPVAAAVEILVKQTCSLASEQI